MGKRKEAVFPEPVCAQAIKSRLLRTMGMLYFWTGVGRSYLADLMLFSNWVPNEGLECEKEEGRYQGRRQKSGRLV